jgi:YebC/PmpR family DNA-binding regulatory protein
MSGHNKWSQIKNKKAKTDGQKSKIFTKYARLITVEAKKAGGNRDASNVKAVVERARGENMPNDAIERAIKKATEANTGSMDAITYESYGPGGCALIIETLTDNKNKAAQEVKFILSQHGSELASVGSALWAFRKVGAGWEPTSTIPLSEEDSTKLEALVDALENNDEVQEVFTNAE